MKSKRLKVASILVLVLSIVEVGLFTGQKMFHWKNGSMFSFPPVEACRQAIIPDFSPMTSPDPVPLSRIAEDKPTEIRKTIPAIPAITKKDLIIIRKSSVNVRSGPSTSFPRLAAALQGDTGEVIERQAGWTRIFFSERNLGGWIRDDLLQ